VDKKGYFSWLGSAIAEAAEYTHKLLFETPGIPVRNFRDIPQGKERCNGLAGMLLAMGMANDPEEIHALEISRWRS